ncbi:hypothetical protein Bca52824_035011 [Brassica carinata]|uniref:Uncharacterized protein n=1 Tax=Brassica carinata TaxID=52824 RepID=A0A8X7S6U8_BRACI|nr:hypothetical protein Bca52824_035011 [Brassica carinata]
MSHKRLRVVHTLEFANGGADIQIMRVGVYEELWASPSNYEDQREELYGVNDGDVRGIFDKNVEFKAGVDINNEETEDMLHGVDDEAVEEKENANPFTSLEEDEHLIHRDEDDIQIENKVTLNPKKKKTKAPYKKFRFQSRLP